MSALLCRLCRSRRLPVRIVRGGEGAGFALLCRHCDFADGADGYRGPPQEIFTRIAGGAQGA